MTPVFHAQVMGKYPAEFFHCANCGFLRIENPHWLEEAYSSAIAVTDTGLVARNLDVARKLAAFLYFVLPGRGAGCFLDAAGGYGMLTRLMRDYGFDFYWSDKYCTNLLARGFEFKEGQVACRAVTAIEVMEHLIDPADFLESALRSAGSDTFIFTTEVYEGAPPQPYEWWYYSLSTGQHIAFFTRRTLRILADRLGMKYYYVAGLHVFTKQAISALWLRLFTKKAIPWMLWAVSKKLGSKCIEDHERMIAMIARPGSER
jgi:hypothetical protein